MGGWESRDAPVSADKFVWFLRVLEFKVESGIAYQDQGQGSGPAEQSLVPTACLPTRPIWQKQLEKLTMGFDNLRGPFCFSSA